MSIMAMILGESGTGKTTSLRDLDPQKCLLIRSIAKPLPFKNKGWEPLNAENPQGSILTSDQAFYICKVLGESKAAQERDIIIFDDFQYIMANEFFRRSTEKGFDKFTEIGANIFHILNAAQALPDTKRVYLLWHTETDSFGKVKSKTIGKMLDEKYTPEGAFTIVLRTHVNNGVYQFSTQNNGSDTVKSPMEMFPNVLIDNNLAEVDKHICEFYGIDAA